MSLTTLEPRTAPVVVDLREGITAIPTEPYSTAEVPDLPARPRG